MSLMNRSVNSAPELPDTAYAQWQDLIEDRLGLQLPPQRRSFLKANLFIRMNELGYSDYLQYFRFVLNGDVGLAEWNVLTDRLTVQETRFFRDPAAFSLVEDHLSNRLEHSTKPLSLWSVGCSTGEEAYSLAMCVSMAIERRQLSQPVRFGVTGTDVSREALSKAREGRFSQRSVSSLDKRLINEFFKDDGEHYSIDRMLADRVCFAKLNLQELHRSPLKNLDVIFCQNVLIYFRKWRRKDIVAELAQRLAPGGLLVLGMGELVDWSHERLTRVANDRALAYLKRQ